MTQGIKRAVKRVLSPEKKQHAPQHRPAHRRPAAGARGAGAGHRRRNRGPGSSGALYDHPELRIAAFDIYYSPNIQFIADAHSIPAARCDRSTRW